MGAFSVLGGLVSYLLFSQIKKHVLDYNTSAEENLKAIKQEKKPTKSSTVRISKA